MQRQDLSCTYLAHHELESISFLITVVIVAIHTQQGTKRLHPYGYIHLHAVSLTCRDLGYFKSLELSKSADSCKTNSVFRVPKPRQHLLSHMLCTIILTSSKSLGWALSMCVFACAAEGFRPLIRAV